MRTEQIIFAAGCFWGVQYYFDQVPGVIKTTVGYTGGHTEYPTYDDVAARMTGHAEATLVEFDPDKVNFKTLLLQFFRMHNPTTLDRQGPDIGDEYRSAIFYFDELQHRQAIEIRNARQKEIEKPIVTEIKPAGPFYPAEEYHQKFTEKTGIGMCHIPYAPVGDQNTK